MQLSWRQLGPAALLLPLLMFYYTPASFTAREYRFSVMARHLVTEGGGNGSAPATPPLPLFDVEARIPRYWMEQTAICANLTFVPCVADNPRDTTASLTRQLAPVRPRGMGVWNTLRFETFTADGRRKHVGGDDWVVQLADRHKRRALAARVFDEGDGTYSAAFIPLAPGNYTITATLHYSDCAGFWDPYEHYEKTLQEDPGCWKGHSVTLGVVPVTPPPAPMRAWCAGSAERILHGPRRGSIARLRKSSSGGGGRSETSSRGGSSSTSSSTSLDLAAPVWRSEHQLYWEEGGAKFRRACHANPDFHLGVNKTRILLYGDSTMRCEGGAAGRQALLKMRAGGHCDGQQVS